MFHRAQRHHATAGLLFLLAALTLPAAVPAATSFHGSSSGAEGLSWALFDPAEGSSWTMNHDGDWRDLRDVLDDYDSEVLWFRRDGQDWVSQDPALLARARAISRPVIELGRRQGALGGQQGKLGARQGRLGAQQGRLGARQAALAASLTRVALRQAYSSGRGSSGSSRREIEREIERIGEEQEALGAAQEALGREQEKLGERQEALGRQQQAASARATREMRELAADAVRSGAAKRLGARRGGI